MTNEPLNGISLAYFYRALPLSQKNEGRRLRGLQPLHGVLARHGVAARGALLPQLQDCRPNKEVGQIQTKVGAPFPS